MIVNCREPFLLKSIHKQDELLSLMHARERRILQDYNFSQDAYEDWEEEQWKE